MKNQPLVSIIVPCYNHSQYITKCIESIINQSYKSFQLIVIDDGSIDNSPAILKELESKHKFVLEIQENMGVANTLNKGILKYATGEYLTFCASDDFWMKDKLDKQVSFMESNPQFPMCFGNSRVVDENNNERAGLSIKINKNLKGGNIFRDLLMVNFHPPVNYLFRKSIFDEVGLYKPGIWTEDFYMNLRISNKHPIGYINEYIAYYRIPNNKGKEKPNLRMVESQLECINEYKHSIYYRTANRKWHLRNFYVLSSFKSTKKQAIIGMLKNIHKCYIPGYIKSFFNLIFVWK